MFAAQGIQLALLARERTGRGQVVNTSLLEATVAVMSWGAGMYFETRRAPGPAGQHHPLAAPYGRFKARDGYLTSRRATTRCGRSSRPRSASPMATRPALRAVPGGSEPRRADARDRGGAGRRARSRHWIELLNAAGIPTGPVLDMAQVFADPQVLARQMLVELPHPQVGTYRTTGLPVKLSSTPVRSAAAAAARRAHRRGARAEAGLCAAELAELRERGAL